jgi:hypothetical protein
LWRSLAIITALFRPARRRLGRRNAAQPKAAKPTRTINHVDGSGTALIVNITGRV